MSTYVLIHGAGGDSWHWHRLAPLLHAHGHDVVAPDLPVTDDAAGLRAYRDVVLRAIGDRGDLVVVGQSLGGFTAPLVCAQRQVQLLILLNAMIPAPGETGLDWWADTGHAVDTGPDFDPEQMFLHDVPADVVAQSRQHATEQSSAPMRDRWPLSAWPDVPTRALITRDDRFFPAGWQRNVVRDRLGIQPDEMPGGHCVALSRPDELAERLEDLRHRYSRPGAGSTPASASTRSVRTG